MVKGEGQLVAGGKSCGSKRIYKDYKNDCKEKVYLKNEKKRLGQMTN